MLFIGTRYDQVLEMFRKEIAGSKTFHGKIEDPHHGSKEARKGNNDI
jgi:hypothetical protein